MLNAARFRPGPENREIVFLTGSGISARTGLGTFRGPEGLWALEPELEEAMHGDRLPGSLPQLWRVWGRMARIAREHGPTPGHRAIARLGAPVITQNIDGLHQAAGSKNVIELHGNEDRYFCQSCGKQYDMKYVAECQGIPLCGCGGQLKPDVVLYGEQLNQRDLRRAIDYARQAELMLVAGTSLVVYPVAGLVEYLRPKARLVILNRDPTPYDGRADLVIREDLTEILAQAAR